ncbi:MAG: 2Fe-2S iron-sulfur cluster binding domain-containing protein [Candidatus Thiodiazotropha sp. (ex Monitilora ramsayi)]|nr:2Fe-2S iron-sulfur cluster binding domain-containing protein [Candidatus Thiodiazotropha sp. (ex Monitilora ramsayi)]
MHAQFDIGLRRSGKHLCVESHQSVLDVMLEAGVDAPFDCRAESCKSCAVEVLAGEVDHRDSALSDSERRDID